MPNFQILHKITKDVLFEGEFDSRKAAVVKAVETGTNLNGAYLTYANLTYANLYGANLTGANLYGANLTDANLTYANLTGANLTYANLTGAYLTYADLTGAYLTYANLNVANLTYANLTGANLTDANLNGAYLTYANLTGANLNDANLTYANLTYANLTGADLTPIRDDFWAVLCGAPSEVYALRDALIEGRVDGSTYEGQCACLVWTIANSAGVEHDSLVLPKPNSQRPAERFFLAIKKGDKPETNQFSALALSWLNTFIEQMERTFGDKGGVEKCL